ncbi:site-specific DNA-methyltransferase [Sporomusa sp.]|uniref:site-specific DNA-methyltransferase n=1 Tax=Sporomusa sp. TaxID=2078658 RepID=UPI002CD2F78C|nr:site-specific DNA-methyltransferase [Sporomusa sp.]HWR07556.1 site-specific DNA-methyltransferase [Sporomusa sp.]
MAAIHDLINQIENPELRARIQQKIDQMNKQKKFGLVFEEHLPECTPLYDIPVRKGSTVALMAGKVNETYVVLKLKDETAICLPKGGGEQSEFPVADLVSVAEFGEAIYPYLKPIDSVCNAPDSDLWHTLIEADNYHALQLLEYLYAGKVDCIYIDPPYNTGAKDWKYNNDYVDNVDTYRHSKWLSMMQKRLKIAKKLLNPKDSKMIVTIDEKEYLHLGCLLEEMFPEARIQMVDSIINRKGVSHKGKKGGMQREEIIQFSRVSEYIFFIMFGKASVKKNICNMLDSQMFESTGDVTTENVQWLSMLRRGVASQREDKPKHFYPIIVDPRTSSIVNVGEPIPLEQNRASVFIPEGLTAVWPMRTNGSEGRWQLKRETFVNALKSGTAKLGSYNKKQDRWAINYLNEGTIDEIEKGSIIVVGKDDKGALILKRKEDKLVEPKSVWNQTSHNASEYGSTLLNRIIGKRFNYPKSLYAVEDVLRMCVGDKPNAIVVDFFAGSGTTLHAVNLLNTEDGGQRRCILVTNNEVSDDEAKMLAEQGYQPGDDEWEKLGIARYVTWPRTVCSIEGHDVNGEPLKGNYLGSDIPMADGFKANAAYFKLSFLNKTDVALGRQFKEMLPTLWMKAGAHGPCPKHVGEEIPTMLVLPENRLAVMTEEAAFPEFEAAVNAHPEIETVYIVTDYEAGYCAMAKNLSAPNTYQLYRDYLDNFRINTGRN